MKRWLAIGLLGPTCMLLVVAACGHGDSGEGQEAETPTPATTPESTEEAEGTETKPELLHTAEEVVDSAMWWLDYLYVTWCVDDPDCDPDPVAVAHLRTELPNALRAFEPWREDSEYYPQLAGWEWAITAAVEVPVKFPHGRSEPYTWDYARNPDGSYITKPVFLCWTCSDKSLFATKFVQNEDARRYEEWLRTGRDTYFYPTEEMMLEWVRQGRGY